MASDETGKASLREWRRRRGMSQNDLATAAGLAPSTIFKAEHSGRAPAWATVYKLAEALGVRSEELDWPEEKTDGDG